ncbi:c-type cytochrome [Azospirillum agricola]|uniref:c-type cytochrome n=1 Tax=Azospirillum agricola TaxID=1720247 RepID=UPI000A0F3203|nr:cytochrome c [Azospirillum agricola]MBP2232648.1 cytochrome c556 [Azospirillum agricola]SMH57736.1 Cytochrome c556 [Azospirillum lipoferum]
MLSRIVIAATAALVLTGGAALAQQDVIKARQAGFSDYKKAMGEIKDALGKGDVAAVAPVGQRIEAFAATIPSLFPAGSDKGKTGAKEVIWANFPDFTAKAKDAENAGKALSAAAATGDKAATGQAFAALADTCKACHQRYRAD